MEEVWRVIETAQRYQVSNLGRVRSPRKILKPAMSNTGYWLVCLIGNDGRARTEYIHRLVAGAFIPKGSDDQVFVNHKDRNTTNNSIENLEWCTPSYNNLHSVEARRRELGDPMFGRRTKEATRKRRERADIQRQVLQRVYGLSADQLTQVRDYIDRFLPQETPLNTTLNKED